MDEVLGEFAIHIIISKLDPDDTARIACVNKKFKAWAEDDSFWAHHCSRDLSLSSPVDPNGNLAPSFMVVYQLWRGAFSMYPWPLVKRVKKCWDKIKTWLGNNYPEVAESLQRGATEEELNKVEKVLNVKFPISTKLLYRLHNGQEVSFENFLGLIGGYITIECFQHTNVYLLPLSEIVRFTEIVYDYLRSSNNVVIAASRMGVEKFFFLNCATMQLSVGTRNFFENGEMIPCVPNSVLMSNECDGLLLWLEEHGRRLETGMVSIREEDYGMKSICQFPEKLPLCTTTVTNGVQVRACAVFAPEDSDVEYSQFMFNYAIRMSLLPEGCTVHGMRFSSCQLYSSHWIIRENETVICESDEESLMREYPLLLPGDKEFFCHVRRGQRSTRGSIEGSFTFFPGRLVEPKGDAFEVEVTRFDLVVPEYIF